MRFLVLLSTLALATSACATGYYVQDDEVYAPTAPPPMRSEVVYAAPGPGHMWVPGSWYWTGRAYVWHAGYWARPPAAQQVWVRSGWVHQGGRYRYVPGRWAPRTARPVHPYYHPPRHNTPRGQKPPPVRGNGHDNRPRPR